MNHETQSECKLTTTTAEPERTRGGRTYVPAVDILEQGDELLLRADVPGARADDIDIQYERGTLTIAARVAPRGDPNRTWVLREYGVGDFVRTFQVGEGIDAQKISAEVRDGVLTLHLPKAESARTRKITVRGG